MEANKMYGLSSFFEGAEKLLEIWFGNDNQNSDTNDEEVILDEFDDFQNISTILRMNEDDDEEKMSNSDSGEDESISFFKKFSINDSGKNTNTQLTTVLQKNDLNADLRRIPKEALEQLLQVVKCEIISLRKTEIIDSFVLSESSMFVSKNRFIIKTCGNTILLRCLKPLLYLVREYTTFDKVIDVFYSHKNWMRPELQNKIHTRFEYEVQFLDNFFQSGAAYCFGPMNKDCHWYFFTLNQDNPSTRLQITEPDQTLEIIMQNLDEQKMQIFTKKICSTAKEATTKSGIDKIFNDAIIDDYLFEPCGYSMNGLIKQYYFTIHITPEPQCSYVSFETNYPMTNYLNLINKVLKIFNPGKFTLTLFANENSISSENMHKLNKQSFPVYKTKDLQYCRVKNYDLTYGHFSKSAC